MLSSSIFRKRHCIAYPRIAKLACKYFAIPCSSVPVESMFSVTGLVMHSRRSSLDLLTLNMLTFIHENIGLLNQFPRNLLHRFVVCTKVVMVKN